MAWGKKGRAKAAIGVGQAQIDMARSGKATVLSEKLSNKERLKMAREGVKNKLDGMQRLNREAKDGGKSVRDTVEEMKATADTAHGIKRNK